MSLIINTKLITDKQKVILQGLDYFGSMELTRSEAAEIITALFEEQRLDRVREREELEDIFATYYNGKLFL